MIGMRRLLLALALTLAALPSQAQDAATGKSLYASAVVAGKQSCSNSACHGALPANPQNRIATGISAATIKTGIASVSQMAFLSGHLTDSQLNDLSAYIASALGGTPTYLTVA